MKKIIVITTLIITLLTVVGMKFISPITQEKPQEEEIDWFDCDSYNYFPQTDAPPVITHEDSIKLQIYIDWYHKEIFPKYRKIPGIVKLENLTAFQDVLRYNIDTLLRRKTIAGYRYKNLSSAEMTAPISHAAAFIGTVVKKRRINDVNRCLHYKTEYVIKVVDLIHSYFNLKNGDYVLAKAMMGYAGGCVKQEDNYYTAFPHIREYSIDDTNFFILKKTRYEALFVTMEEFRLNNREIIIDDEYCNNAFEIIGRKEFMAHKNEIYDFCKNIYTR